MFPIAVTPVITKQLQIKYAPNNRECSEWLQTLFGVNRVHPWTVHVTHDNVINVTRNGKSKMGLLRNMFSKNPARPQQL